MAGIIDSFRYGADQGASDLFGDQGILGFIPDSFGYDRYQPTVEEPKQWWEWALSEIPRSTITSGGQIWSRSLPRMIAGSALSGAALPPVDPELYKQGYRSEHPVAGRLGMGALFGGLGAAGWGLGRLAGGLGRGLFRAAHAKELAGIQNFGEVSPGFQNNHFWQSKADQFKKNLEALPRYKGKLRRGVRPDNAPAIAELNKLKKGQVWKPGRALPSDQYGVLSKQNASGAWKEGDIYTPHDLPEKPGPMIYIKTKNARIAGYKSKSEQGGAVGRYKQGVLGWDEVITLPDSQFRVDKIVRDEAGNVVEVHVTDLSDATMGRKAIEQLQLSEGNLGGQAINSNLEAKAGTGMQKARAKVLLRRKQQPQPKPVKPTGGIPIV